MAVFTTCIFYKALTAGLFACFYWHTQTNFRFYWQKVSFPKLAWGDFQSDRLNLLRTLCYPWEKNTVRLPGEKIYLFLSSQKRHKFSIFSANRAFI